jgi:VWFA-related protein
MRLQGMALLLLVAAATPVCQAQAQNAPPGTPPVQESADAPRLRVTRNAVVVDVVVTDRSNRHVRGLTAADFELLEDGVVQDIELFQAVNPSATPEERAVEPVWSGSGRDDGPRLQPGVEAGPVNLVIFLLDYATVEFLNQGYVREAAQRYVRTRMQANDLMAVFQVGRGLKFLQNFTNDPELVASALSSLDPAGSAFAYHEETVTDFAESVQDQVETLTTSIDNLGAAGSQIGPQAAAAMVLMARELETAKILEGTYYAQRSFGREIQSRPIIGAIETIARAVSHLPGRKTLILFSQGFSVPMTLERPLYRAVDLANKANLAIYSVDAGGLQYREPSEEGELFDISAARLGDRVKAYGGLSQFDRAREIGSDQKDSTLRYISAATGGFVVRHTNDFFRALERIEGDVRSHYVLTYTPKNPVFDGRFRTIEVRVPGRDLRVRARNGYWAVPQGASVLSAEEFQELLRVGQTAGNEPLRFYGHTAWFPAPEGRYQVHVNLEVAVDQFSPAWVDNVLLVDVDALGLIEDERGEVVSSFRGPSRIRLTGDMRHEARSFRLESRFELSPGRYSVRVLLGDPVSGRRSVQFFGLQLPPWDPGMSMASLVVGKAEELLRSDTADDFFTVERVRVVPSARRDFRTGEDLVYLVNVFYPPEWDMPEGLELETAVYRNGACLARQRAVIPAGEAAAPQRGHLKLARYLGLDGFAPGRYLLQATVRDPVRDERETVQTVFRVER